jgi:hypothetical protein
LVSDSTYKDALTHCGLAATQSSNPYVCKQIGVDGGQTAHSQATVSTVAFIVGPALLAGGAYLYFTAPKAEVAVAPTTSGGGGALLSLRGRW